MSRVVVVVLAAFAAALVGCRSPEEPDAPSILLLGSRGMVPMLTAITERFREKHPGVRIDIEPALGERAVADTRAGLVDIGLIGRGLRAEETGVKPHPIARDGIAFGVNKTNEVQPLAENHLVGVLTRVYTTWWDVGGTDRPIILIGPGEGRAVRDVLLDQFALRQPQLQPNPAMGSSKLVWQAVAAQPAAFGYGSLGSAETSGVRGEIRLLPFHGVPATVENVRNRSYPLARPLLLLTREQPSGNVKELVDFALSQACHDLIAKYGYVPATP